MQNYKPLISSGVPINEIPDLNALYDKGKLEAPEKPRRTPSKELNSKVILARMDLTKLNCDAIVNAANKSLLGGGGIDGAIHNAAGNGLYQECRTLNGCRTGDAKITKGYRLPAKHVIHTVGPIYHSFGGDDDPDAPSPEEQLRSCYVRSLDVGRENGCTSVAFCCISTGIYGYPNVDAAIVALRTVRAYLEDQEKETEDEEVVAAEVKAIVEKEATEAEAKETEGEKDVKADDKKEAIDVGAEAGKKEETGAETKPEVKDGEAAKESTSTEEPKEADKPTQDKAAAPAPVEARKKTRVKIEKVMFCTFLEKDQRIYEHFVPIYFPPESKAEEPEAESKTEGEAAPVKEATEEPTEKSSEKTADAEASTAPVADKKE